MGRVAAEKENVKLMEYNKQLLNLNEIKIDNTISLAGCTWGVNATIKVIS